MREVVSCRHFFQTEDIIQKQEYIKNTINNVTDNYFAVAGSCRTSEEVVLKGTPAFIVEGRDGKELIMGTKSYSEFQEYLDHRLGAQR